MTEQVLFSLFIIGFYPFILLCKGIRWALSRQNTIKKQIDVVKAEQKCDAIAYYSPIRPQIKVFPDRDNIDFSVKNTVNKVEELLDLAYVSQEQKRRKFVKNILKTCAKMK